VYSRRGFLDVTARLVRHYIHTDPTRAWAVLERCRNFEPLNEHVYADIIALQMKSGNNQGAQRTWELLVSHLAEIGQTPSPATAALLRGDTSANTPDVTPE
jgi:DNA-binding SARP family transcriptional activator